MKKRRFRLLSFLLAAVLLLCFTWHGLADDAYNDEWVLRYENMREKTSSLYRVPTLFKNDESFRNHRTFPLVVHENVHYVPLEMFSGLSEISLNTSFSSSNFYITNSENSSYISFDVASGYATTHQMKSYKLETQLFYSTRYVPAKAVSDVLGIKMEVYENPDDGVYALRFCDDRAKLPLEELIKMYSPIKKPKDGESDEVTDNPPPDDVPSVPHEEDNVPALPEIGRRDIHLTFDLTRYGYADRILASLKQGGVKAVFFVRPSDILEYPDKIRSIIVGGHEIGFLLDGKMPHESLSDGRNNLYLVAKRTTRLVRFEGGSSACVLSDTDILNFTVGNGLCLWDYNISASDSSSMYDRLYDALYNLRATSAIVRISPDANTSHAITRLCTLVSSNKNLRFIAINETTKPLRYR